MIKLQVSGTIAKGFLTSPRALFLRFAKELSAHFQGMTLGGGMGPGDEKGGFVLAATIHPAAAPIDVTFRPPNRLFINAPTGSVGPGYHQFVCDAIRAVGNKLKITWDASASKDPSDYFFTPNRRAVEAMFLSSAGDTAAELVDLLREGRRDLDFGMPTPDRFFHDKAVSTVLGPRSKAWLERVAEKPLTASDAFAWWDTGLGANYFLGRGLAMLWLNIRHRPPMNDDEQKCIKDMLDSFERAYALAPSLQFPWKEWDFFLKMTSRPPDDLLTRAVRQNAQKEGDRQLFGYRRGNYQAVFPSGWKVTVPASFAEQVDGQGTWRAWDGKRTVQVGAMPVADEMRRQAPADLLRSMPSLDPGGGVGEDMNWEHDGVASKANIHRANEGGRQYWRIGTLSAAPGSLLNMVINFDDEADREWAMGVWNSVRFELPRPEITPPWAGR